MSEPNPRSNTLRADEPYNKQTKPRLICDKCNGMSKVEIRLKCKTNFVGEYVSVIFKSTSPCFLILSLQALPSQTIPDIQSLKTNGKIVLNFTVCFDFERLDKASFNSTSGINSYYLIVISSCIPATAVVYVATCSGI